MSEISIQLLGEVTVIVEGELRRLSGQRPRAVLAYLALHATRPVGVDQLIDALWGDRRPKTARNSIQRFVSDVRRALGPFAERIETVAEGYLLRVTPDEIDVRDAEGAIAGGRAALSAGNPTEAVESLQRGLARWSGRALGGLGDADFATGEISRLEEVRNGALEDVFDAELARGRHREIAGAVESFARENRTRERAWSLLMLTRYRCERQAEAIAAYQELRGHLEEELGIEPSPSVEELYLQILEHVPEVDPPAVSAGEADLVDWPLDSPLAIPMPRPLERSSRFPMSGREAEVAALIASRESLAGGASSVLLVGEAGIGKTRLASEVAARFHREGMVVLYGRCEEDLSAPYRPWVDAIDHLVRHAPAHLLQRYRERFGPVLSTLVPSLRADGAADPGRSEPEVGAPDDGHRQAVLFHAVVELLEDSAAQRPTLLVLDDLHWADSSSLRLLRHVAANSGAPLLLIGAYRDTDVDDSHPLADTLGALHRESKSEWIHLDGLSDGATHSLVDTAVPAEHAERNREIAAAIRQETNGNPFFITEILPSVAESEASSPDALERLLREELPDGIQRVLRQRIARLGEDSTQALRTASVFGREFELDLLAGVLERPELDLLDLVEGAIRAGLVTDAAAGRDRFSFTHDIIHHYLYHGMSRSRRGRTHSLVASVIEAKYGDSHEDWIEPLATHRVAAADPAQHARTILACRRAGARAAAASAPAEAVLWFERALRQLAEQGDPDDSLRAALLVELGMQQRNAGERSHWSTLTEAGRLALEIGQMETLVDAVLANSRSLNARPWEIETQRVELLRAALDALGPAETAPRANLMASLANEQWDADHRPEAETLYRESIALARRVGDPTTLATTLIRVSRARNLRLGRDELHAISREIAALASGGEITDPLVRTYCSTTVLNTALQLGLAQEAREAMRLLWEAEERSELPLDSSQAHLARSLAAGLCGDVEEYERLSRQIFELPGDGSVDLEERQFIVEGQLFYSRYLQGRTHELVEAIAKIVRERPDVALYRAVSAILHTEARLLDEASAMLDQEVARGFEPASDMFAIQSLTLWAEAAASVGHVESCRLLYEILGPFTTEMAGHLVQVTEPVDLALGRLCTCLGLYEEAAAHFDVAARIADDFDGKWMRARTDLNRAQLFVVRGAEGDREVARHLAREAATVAEDQGYAAVLRDAERVLVECGVS